jgi:hypothetical protein
VLFAMGWMRENMIEGGGPGEVLEDIWEGEG